MSRRKLPDTMPATVMKRRCAVYTRKSTDEGLEKEFNNPSPPPDTETRVASGCM